MPIKASELNYNNTWFRLGEDFEDKTPVEETLAISPGMIEIVYSDSGKIFSGLRIDFKDLVQFALKHIDLIENEFPKYKR